MKDIDVERDRFLPHPHIETHIDHDGSRDEGVRVFRTSPETVGLQLRTYGPTNGKFGRSKGKYRAAYSHVSLNPAQIDWLLRQLAELRNELKNRAADSELYPTVAAVEFRKRGRTVKVKRRVLSSADGVHEDLHAGTAASRYDD